MGWGSGLLGVHSLFPPSKLAFSDAGGGALLVVVGAAASRARANAMAAIPTGLQQLLGPKAGTM